MTPAHRIPMSQDRAIASGERRIEVVVTGIGLYTSLGHSCEPTWSALRNGQSAAGWLDSISVAGEPRFCGFTRHAMDHRTLEQVCHAAMQALDDANLIVGDNADPHRVATLIGLSKGDIQRLCVRHEALNRLGPEQSRPGMIPGPNLGASVISESFDFRGPNLSPVAACATGVVAAIQGASLIRQGVCDVAIVGAGDSSLRPFVLSAFRRMKALARVEDDPARAVCPWDRRRSGFLPGEGAAVLVLERADHARARGVVPYAEFAGGAFGSDAYHITDLNPDPANLAHVIGLALKNADMQASDLEYVNVHGTATRQNDPLECRAIRRALGTHADSVSCSANKAQIGHLLGAAGAAELAITCLAMRDGFVPPTLNLDDPDPACDLDGTPHIGKERDIRTALKISIGFGGHLVAAVLRRPDGSRRPPVPLTPMSHE